MVAIVVSTTGALSWIMKCWPLQNPIFPPPGLHDADPVSQVCCRKLLDAAGHSEEPRSSFIFLANALQIDTLPPAQQLAFSTVYLFSVLTSEQAAWHALPMLSISWLPSVLVQRVMPLPLHGCMCEWSPSSS